MEKNESEVLEKEEGNLILILTSECNLRCTYCYEDHKKRKSMSLETAKQVISEVLNREDKYRFVRILLFGGEPLLEFELIREMCEWTWKNNWPVKYIFSFSTNGTLLNKEMKAWIQHNRDKIELVLSADGNKYSQDINRSNSFDKIDFDFFIKTNEHPMVKMTISRESLPFLYENVVFFHEKGFDFAECNMAVGIDWKNEELYNILREQLEQLVQYYKVNKHLTPANILNMDLEMCERIRKVQKWCGVGKELMTVDTDGKRYPCNYITPMSFSNEDLQKLLSTDFTKDIEILDGECLEKCYLFPICPTCYAADYSLTGKIKTKNKSACKLVELRAYYTAILQMDRMEDIDIGNLSDEEKFLLYKRIQAIKKIIKDYIPCNSYI